MKRSLPLATLVTLFLAITAPLLADVSTSQLPVLTNTEIVTLDSQSVGDAFVLYVRVPPEAAADPEKRFPVIYALDGDHTFPMTCSIATELGWSGAVPPAIVVGVGYGTLDLQNGNHRSRDLSPQPYRDEAASGGGPAFLQFLLTEAFPHIEANYPADPEQRYLFGHSLGGLFALYAYAETPDTFQGIVAGSPFLAGQLDFLEQAAADHTSRKTRLSVITGEQEDPAFFIDDLPQLRSLLETKWAASGTFEMALLPGYDHFTMVAPSISGGLKSVFAR